MRLASRSTYRNTVRLGLVDPAVPALILGR
jgi:hypothetical protein